ncbi:hypothetical protein AHAS_AhasUnG0034300 [Arachis hypogaea]
MPKKKGVGNMSYLPNGYNLRMVKLHTASMYCYLQRIVRRSMWGEACGCPVGPGDFLVHYAISLGLHTTTLILVKGALDARGFKLMLDKKDFGYSFSCDGPGRGGTCDISAWDAFY